MWSYLEQKREEEVEKLMLKIKKAEKMEIAIKQQKMKKKFWRGISNSKAIKLFFKTIEWCYTKRDMKLRYTEMNKEICVAKLNLNSLLKLKLLLNLN